MSEHPDLKDAERIRVSLQAVDGGARARLTMTLRATTVTIDFPTVESKQADADFQYMVANADSIVRAALMEAEAMRLTEDASE